MKIKMKLPISTKYFWIKSYVDGTVKSRVRLGTKGGEVSLKEFKTIKWPK